MEPDFTPLRAAQEHGLEASGASLPLVKKLCRQLEDEGYTEKERQGRSFVVRLTSKGVDYQASLIANPTPAPTSTPASIPDSGVVLRSRTPKQQWAELMREVNQRGLQTAFVPPNAPLYVEIEGELCPVTSRG